MSRVFLIDVEADDSLAACTQLNGDIDDERYRLYAAIENDEFDYGVILVKGMAGLACAFASLRYLLEGKLQALWISGERLPLDLALEDRWERARLDEVLASGKLVQAAVPVGQLSAGQVALGFQLDQT